MPAINSLKELLIDEVKDLYSAEKHLVKALPKMAKAASNEDLKEGFQDHLDQTKVHVERLEKVAKLLGVSPSGKTCHAIVGLVEEGDEAIEVDAPDSIRDAYLIGAAQRVEHYEMAAYGTARAFAEKLGEEEIAALLQETLNEEGDANKKLTALANGINDEAANTEAEDAD